MTSARRAQRSLSVTIAALLAGAATAFPAIAADPPGAAEPELEAARLVVSGTPGHSRVDVDAFLVLR